MKGGEQGERKKNGKEMGEKWMCPSDVTSIGKLMENLCCRNQMTFSCLSLSLSLSPGKSSMQTFFIVLQNVRLLFCFERAIVQTSCEKKQKNNICYAGDKDGV